MMDDKSVFMYLSHVIVSLSLLLTPVLGMNCYACLPSVEGGTFSMDVALKWTANITRTWSERRESTFGFCTSLSSDPKFQVTCPNSGAETACVEASRSPPGSNIPDWEALTCGVLPPQGEGCFKDADGVVVCYCITDYCNEGSIKQLSHFLVFLTGIFSIVIAQKYLA